MSGYGDFSEFYDALTDDVEYARISEYITALLAKNGVTGGLLVDLACGTGSLSVEMAKRGFEVIGVDASSQMLSRAQQKAFDAGENILFLCQEMQKLDLYGTVNAVICTLDSINHLTNEQDVRETFRRVSLFLDDGGVFVLDLNTPYKHREILADNTYVLDTREVYCVWRNSLDAATDTVEISLDFFSEEKGMYRRSTEHFFERAYDTKCIISYLEELGLTVTGTFAELSHESPLADTQRIVITAVK